MTTYHASRIDPLEGTMCLEPVLEGDYLVPHDEVHDGNGRWINCAGCAEALAVEAGGSTKRPGPPPGWQPEAEVDE